MKKGNMKKTDLNNNTQTDDDEMLDHYELDYSKAKPNRFAPILAEQEGFIKLQPDVKKIFKTSDEVNNVLRAIINAYPKAKKIA